MAIWQHVRQGFRLAAGSGRLLLGLWLVNLLVALPAALVLAASLQASFGKSLVNEEMRQGLDTDWHAEYAASAKGLEETFTLSALNGAGPLLDNLEGWLSGEIFNRFPGLVGMGILFALLWAFLLGGVIDHLARPYGPPRLEGFAAACGRYFPNFLRLFVLTSLVYFAIYRAAHWLYGRLEVAMRDVTRETTVFGWVLAIAALMALALIFVRMVADYAKIMLVREERQSALGAAWASLRFVLAQPLRTLGLCLVHGLATLLLLLLYALVAPGPGESSALGILAVFLLAQVYLILRLLIRLSLLGSELSLYEKGLVS